MSFDRLPIIQSDPLAFTPGTLAVAPVAYDTALVGQLRTHDGAPRFPATIAWLLSQQHPDGTWGSTAWHAYDRLVSTLAALRCLATQRSGQAAVQRALAVVPALLERLDVEAHETVGFELIAPALLDRCADAGLPVPVDVLPQARQRRATRLAAGVNGTACFSLEALDQIPHALGRWVSPRGSLFASPAAAAAYLAQYPATSALADHLAWLVRQHQGGLPAVHPLDSFAAAWVCWHLHLAGLGHLPALAPLRRWVRRSWTAQGASFSDDFTIPNADDTALSFLVQCQDGPCPDIAVFAPYLTPQGVRCFVHEYDSSVSTNLHVLLALQAAPPSRLRDTWIAWILSSVQQARAPSGLLADKWHASPVYPTSHAIIATFQLDEAVCAALCAALLQIQHPDGAWGLGQGSAEETAYALLALCHAYHPAFRPAIAGGITALERFATRPRPALWIGKSLYRPIPVVESAILAAWHLAHTCLS